MTQKPYKCRVEYLESSGTQWLKTYCTLTANTKIDVLFSPNQQATANLWVIGSYVASNKLTGVRITGETTLDCYINTVVSKKVSGSNIGNKYQAVLDGKWTVNGSEGTAVTVSAGLSPLTLFGWNASTTANNYAISGLCSTKIYHCKIWDNNTIVRDFIPVLDNSGRPAMYDQVSGQLFYNQGSGEFTYGRQIIPVEYLESTGTQYIDTGLKGKNNIDFDYKCIFTNLDGTSQCVGGNWSGASSSSVSLYLGLIRTNGNFAYHYDGTSSPVVIMNTTVQGTPYSVQGHMWVGEQYMVINGTKSSVGTISSTFTSSLNMYLFGINNNGLSNPAYMKFYYCKIYDNGVLVRDFIPCIDENLTPFMFDKVQNTVYLNAGTGQFKVGPNVEKIWSGRKLRRKLALALANLKKPRKYYCEIEYLEGTGTQYIDTGLDYFADFEIGIKLRNNVSNKALGNIGTNCMERSNSSAHTWLFTSGGSGYGSSINILEYNVMKWKDGKIYADDTLLAEKEKVKGTGTMILFGAGYPYPNMIYFCKLWNPDNGELVRDFIPVLDWDMTPCMYDKISGQLFYNAGTGDFVAGREIHYVDYLESTGVEYIDTGVSGGNDNLKIEMGFSYSKFTAYGYFFSNYESETANVTRFCLNGTDTNTGLAYINTKAHNGAIYTSNFTKDTFHTFVLTKTSVSIDGSTRTNDNPPSGTANTKNIILFNRGSGSYTDKRDIGMRCYYFRIYDNDILVRDYIPAIDENGTAYLFDRVTHTIYDNAGQGSFKYPAREVEYLESDGARAIVAGVTVDDTCGYNVKWMALNADDRIILGTKGSGDSRWVLSGINNPNVNLSWNTSYGGIGLGLNKIQTAQMNYLNDRKRILNGIPLADITTPLASAASTYNVGIFGGYWGAATISLYSTCRIYYAKISKGTELIRDFIPMVKDGSPCLYDKVGGEYYFGIGTGSFTTGKIVEPEYE